MTTFYDVPAENLIPALSVKLGSEHGINMPEWAAFVKTGVHRERPPVQNDWWVTRSAAILRKVAREGPVGVNHLSQSFGGRVERGSAPNRAASGSRHIIRTILQQLEEAGLVEKSATKVLDSTDDDGERITLYAGRKITSSGHKLLDSTAHEVREQVEASHPGMEKY